MRTTKHCVVILLCALLYVPTALAQRVRDKFTDQRSALFAANVP
jgi:hypothetical protein